MQPLTRDSVAINKLQYCIDKSQCSINKSPDKPLTRDNVVIDKPQRLLSTTSMSITQSPLIPTILLARRSINPPSLALCLLALVCFTIFQCHINRFGNSGFNFSGRPHIEMAPLFPDCDYEHWLIVMDKPGGEGTTKQRMIDCYLQTIAKIVGIEEEAKKRIYNVSCERYFGFGCEIDEETSFKLEGLLGILFVLPRD
ncbi:multiple organellar RNA editing factor 2, chloroplastic-like [Neltuma alba]|uniref:multiple organellar RNA editing factor 2, chloroplastic-like n=1 Tax=Neltuma alba TaxID=207710 RepID=UPI0010A50D03|nr:multiple organellar RNA editing factor 2, chloroplastic-like [Prosopis alba]